MKRAPILPGLFSTKRSIKSGWFWFWLLGFFALAWANTLLGPATHYTTAQIQAAVEAAPGYNATIMSQAGGLGTFESQGNAGITNIGGAGNCCTGVFQMNRTNLAAIGLTPTQYANETLQQQANQWVALTNQGANNATVRQLEGMSTLGGTPVTSSLILSCIQLGTGNCQKTLNAGSCAAGFHDANGTTICDMARNVNANQPTPSTAASNSNQTAQPNQSNNQPANQTQTQGQTAAQQAQQTQKAAQQATQPPAQTQPSQQTQTQSASQQNVPQPQQNPFNITTSDVSMNYLINMNGVTYTPEQQGAAGSLTSIGDPTVCWICNTLVYALGVVELVNTSAVPILVQEIWPFMVILGGLSFMMKVGKAVIEGAPLRKPIAAGAARLAVVCAFFIGGALQPFGTTGSTTPTNPGMTLNMDQKSMGGGGGIDQDGSMPAVSTSNGSLIFDFILGAPLAMGAQLAQDLAGIASTALNVQMPTGNCTNDSLATAGVSQLVTPGTALLTLACQIHESGVIGIQIGGLIITHPGADTTAVDIGTDLVMMLVGIMVLFLSFTAVLNFGFALVEAVIKIGVISAFSPFLIFCYLFDFTRPMVKVLLDQAIFVVIYLAFSGLGSVVMVYVMINAFTFGLGQTSPVSLTQVLTQFDQILANAGLTSTAGLGQILQFACFTSAGSLLAARVMRGAHDLAVELSGFALGQRGQAASVGAKLVNTTMSVGAAAGGIAGALGSRAVGKAIGAAAGRAVGRARPSAGRVAAAPAKILKPAK